jgi:hypothetical protein
MPGGPTPSLELPPGDFVNNLTGKRDLEKLRQLNCKHERLRLQLHLPPWFCIVLAIIHWDLRRSTRLNEVCYPDFFRLRHWRHEDAAVWTSIFSAHLSSGPGTSLLPPPYHRDVVFLEPINFSHSTMLRAEWRARDSRVFVRVAAPH